MVAWSGGTDRMIYDIVSTIRKPALIYSHPGYNSLASAREAVAALRYSGLRAGIAYGGMEREEIKREVEPFIAAVKAVNELRNDRLGVVGRQEPWLLISRSAEVILNRLGVRVVLVDWRKLHEHALGAREDEVNRVISKLKKSFGRITVSSGDLEKAVRLYLGMKSLAREFKLSCLAVEARDMLDPGLRDWGPYLGVALMSDDGVPADYEIDYDAILTKLIIYRLTGGRSFVANLTQVNPYRGTAVFSHCTIPVSMIDASKSLLTTYFETNKTVAIRGRLREGSVVTFARIGGRELDKLMFGRGVVVNGDLGRGDLCRTQVEVKIDGDLRRLIEEPLGNHMVITYNDAVKHLTYLCRLVGIQPVRV